MDDVARDVFRISLWQEDRDKFRQINDVIAQYYENKASAEITSDNSPPQIYENKEWLEYTAESLYHALYARQTKIDNKFISHLFCGCYLQQTDVVTIPFNAITAEFNLENNQLLHSSTIKFLQAVEPIFDVNCLAFEKWLISVLDEQEKTFIKFARDYCFRYLNSLTGLAKFVALLYKSKYCSTNQKLKCLEQTKSQAEELIIKPDIESDVEFSSGLFLWDLGNTYAGLGKHTEAIASYDRAIKIKPDKDEAWNNRGVGLGNLGKHTEAIASYDRAIKIKPDKDEAWNNRGVALGNLGKHKEAIASYDQALKIKSDDDQAWYNRGVALGNLGKHTEAISSYDRAIKIKPDDDRAWYNRACCFALQNHTESAIEDLARAISLNQEWRETAKTDSDFDNIRNDARFIALISAGNLE